MDERTGQRSQTRLGDGNQGDGEAKNQISAPSISLPKGGGAIRGMGEKLTAHPVTSTGSMTVHNRGTFPNLSRNDPIEGKPNLAIGYDPGFLPSFALPPVELTDLSDLCSDPERQSI